jgi:DNA-binding transcriptional LysR family regulator
MSIALGRLRTLFGDPLLLRGHGEMLPTTRGLALIGAVRTMVEGLDTLTSSPTPFDPMTSRNQFTLTAPGYIGHVLLPRLMRQLERSAPGVYVEVRASNRERASEWLEKGEVDFRIGWIRELPPSCGSKRYTGMGLYASRARIIHRSHASLRQSCSARFHTSEQWFTAKAIPARRSTRR